MRCWLVMPFMLCSCMALWVGLSDTAGSAEANAFDKDAPVDEAATEEKYVEDLERRAAAYRGEALHHHPSAAEEAGALYHLEHARQLLADDHLIFHLWRSTRTAERGFNRYPYSSCAGDLLMIAIDGYIARHRLTDVNEKLLMIWFYMPDYPRTGEAMEKALAAAEREQHFATSVHLEAEKPSQVISIVGHNTLADSDKLLLFLALHGDRETVAPRAELDLARSQLLSGTRDELYAARRSYERFLEKYPNDDLTFTALLEHALSYLIGYRGDDYDNGALVFASAIIDQAELETHGDEAKSQQIQAYRRRIRLWQQDRDLSIARWYDSRGTFAWQWFVKPPGLTSWADGARYYYLAVVARDSSSPQGRIAARELASLPKAGAPR
jgi:hypothetical protein